MDKGTTQLNSAQSLTLKWYKKYSGLFFLIMMLLISNSIGYNFLKKNEHSFAFYQNEFAPSVMFACGYGFFNPSGDNQPLRDFLSLKRNTLSCKDINHTAVAPLNFFQKSETYLFLSIGLTWKFFGLGWSNLIPLFLILYSVAMTALYFIFCLGLRRETSFFLTLCVSLSLLQLSCLLQLRDYAVAPFLLLILLVTGILVTKNLSSKKLLLLSALGGIILGTALGFRTDLLVLLPFFILTVIFFIKTDKNPILNRLGAIFLFLTCFLLLAAPTLNNMHQHGGHLAHVIILGLADSFTQDLGLKQPETYSLIPAYRDLIAYTTIDSFAERIYGVHPMLLTASKGYVHYGKLFLLHYLYHFPADILVRIYASIHQIMTLSFHNLLGRWSFLLTKTSLFFPLFSILVIGLYQFRVALFILFTLLYLGAYPVLQYAPRHYFYLSFIGFWFLGFFIESMLTLIINSNNKAFIAAQKYRLRTHGKKIFFSMIVCPSLLYTILLIARDYQTTHLISLFNNYLHSESTIIAPVLDKTTNKYRITLPAKKQNNQTNYLDTVYLKITSNNYCNTNKVTFKIHYLEVPLGFWNAPHELNVPKNTTYFIPIYNYHNSGSRIVDETDLPSYWIDFIEYSTEDSLCIKNISTVQALDKKPLLLKLSLQLNWDKTKLYQIFEAPNF